MKEEFKHIGQYKFATHRILAVLFSGEPITVHDVKEISKASNGLISHVMNLCLCDEGRNLFPHFDSITETKPYVHAWEGEKIPIEEIVAKYNILENEYRTKIKKSKAERGTPEITVNNGDEERGTPEITVNNGDEAWIQLGRAMEAFKMRGISVTVTIEVKKEEHNG